MMTSEFDLVLCPLILPGKLLSFHIFLPKMQAGFCFFQIQKYPFPHFTFLNSLYSNYCSIHDIGRYSFQNVTSKFPKRSTLKNMFSYYVLEELLGGSDFLSTVNLDPPLSFCCKSIGISINDERFIKFCINMYLDLLFEAWSIIHLKVHKSS